MRRYLLTAAVFLLVNAALTASAAPISSLDGRDPEVSAILEEINAIIRHKFNLTSNNRAAVDAESLAVAKAQYDDIRFTPYQAKYLLSEAKRRFGIPVETPTSRGIYPYTSKWTLPIKYAFESTHTEAEKQIVREGIKWWSDQTCITFSEYSSSKAIGSTPHLRIIKGEGCWSYQGIAYNNGQDLSLGTGCTTYPGTAAHEIGHALGLNHEHQRPDRDTFLTINWANVAKGMEYAFALLTPSGDVDYGNTHYDVLSIMHYDSLGFSVDYWGGKKTMVPIYPHQVTAIGQITRMSFFDLKRINTYYNCINSKCSAIKLGQPCQNGGYQDPKNCYRCRCPPGLDGPYCDTVAPSVNMATCGGTIVIPSCSMTTLTLPTHPNRFNDEASCTWRVTTASCGLAFAFEKKPDMSCNFAETCYEYVEIRTNSSLMTMPGKVFCKCGTSNVRITVDGSEAYVHFKSTTSRNGGQGGTGFQLTAYATCGTTLASDLSPACNVAASGYDGKSTYPRCPTSTFAQGPTGPCPSKPVGK